MSPIGRVFIVLNLLASAVFVGFAGTNLKFQHNYKEKWEASEKAIKERDTAHANEKKALEDQLNSMQVSKNSVEAINGQMKNQLDKTNDEIKRLTQQNSSYEGDIKKLTSLAEAGNTQVKEMAATADAAYKMAIADQKTKDEAVRARETAEAENRGLKQTIAALNTTISDKDGSLATLTKDNNEQKLLVSVAKANGFLPSMAAPNLSGTVLASNGRLCSIKISDNPNKVDIAEHIATHPFGFAVYDASGFKAEAVATKYEAAEGVVLCNVSISKADIKVGDKASTKTY